MAKKDKARVKRWLATPQGQLWLDGKIAEKIAGRPDPGPAPERLSRTKLPFAATINGRPVTVWPDWIETED